MKPIQVGLWGFGKTGRLVANEFLNDKRFDLSWVVRKSTADHHKYASRLLGQECDTGEIISIEDMDLLSFASTLSMFLLISPVRAAFTPISTPPKKAFLLSRLSLNMKKKTLLY